VFQARKEASSASWRRGTAPGGTRTQGTEHLALPHEAGNVPPHAQDPLHGEPMKSK